MLNSLRQPVFRFLPLLLVALMCMSLSHAARFGKQDMRVYDQGLKEDTRVYSVICENGTRVSVSARFDLPPPLLDPEGNVVNNDDGRRAAIPPSRRKSGDLQPIEICAHPYGKKEHCKSRWDINKAAKYACQKSKRK